MSASTRTAAARQRDMIIRATRQRIDPTAYAQRYQRKSLEILSQISDTAVAGFINILRVALQENRHIFTCRNGGSAATASHLAAGLGKDSSRGRERKFRVMSLADNVPWITSLANDADYSAIFVEQLENFAQPDDVLIAFSGSGNSANIVRAIEWANENGLLTVGITGRPGGTLGQRAQHPIFVESTHMGHVEEAHFVIQHMVSYYFEDAE